MAMKATLAALLSIVRICLLLFYSNQFKRTEELLLKNPDGAINTELVWKALDVIEYGVYVSRSAYLFLICCSLKWRNLAHYYFACEVFVNMLEALMPFAEHNFEVALRTTYLIINYWALSVKPVKMNLICALIYYVLYVYLQTLTYVKVTAVEALLMTVPQALFAFVSMLAYNVFYMGCLNIAKERDLFKLGHFQFVHNLREGMIIMQGKF